MQIHIKILIIRQGSILMSLFFLKSTTAAVVVYNYFLFANSFATLKDYYSYCFRHKKILGLQTKFTQEEGVA